MSTQRAAEGVTENRIQFMDEAQLMIWSFFTGSGTECARCIKKRLRQIRARDSWRRRLKRLKKFLAWKEWEYAIAQYLPPIPMGEGA